MESQDSQQKSAPKNTVLAEQLAKWMEQNSSKDEK
jgi:hypothetical protein